MTRFNLTISAEDLLDLLKKQRARCSGKMNPTVSSSDFAQAKDLINKLEELDLVIGANPLTGSDEVVTIYMKLSQAPSPSLPRGTL